ncbi:NifB/NifX family molybdenum-iron cluster-binding protein [Azospirillum sp. TSO22-1]|uniref:NifB/NifX family molybdenum-iron cluster-binding protein n=1 Tax=Azospirillum sp. TSO22-1 TaxID=716789 RepID=UPI000D607818|nr:NifB/NifX family molybdenum-iron cluster-binding protein [Azospirillum sp. TSO22-1]PWC42390.1 vanadium nitrogenase [Azospirillum sp. TSO22-1]
MIRVAFASDDQAHVNLHFGGGERFVVYDVRPGEADLVTVAEFVRAQQKGVNAERAPGEPPPSAPDPDAPVEDKVAVKLAFLEGCSAVYAASIGASAIKRLMAAGIQPIIVDKGHDILDLLNEVSLAQVHGGLPWVTRALRAAGAPAAPARGATVHRLITSIDDMD